MTVTIGTRTIYTGSHDYASGEETVKEVAGKTECYIVEGFIDLSEMAAGDTYVLKEYAKVDGTNYRCFESRILNDVQTEPLVRIHAKVIPSSVSVPNDWKLTITKNAGTNRDFDYSLVVCEYTIV